MKQYTHAWIAMMAIKRLERAAIPEKERVFAASLVRWFKDHRDDVIVGAWYPDAVIKDMATGHILKHVPDTTAKKVKFRKLPDTYHLFKTGKMNPYFDKPYRIDQGNLPDRCEAITHSIIDNLKMFNREEKGSTILPSANHIAALFFMLSHYIADAHMPLHCDGRKYNDKKDLHAKIEDDWEDRVKKYYSIDFENDRFIYDKSGFPFIEGTDPLMDWIEGQIVSRSFDSKYGPNNKNTWDFMSAIAQYSYLTAYELVPDTFDVKVQDYQALIDLITPVRFDEISKGILIDSIDSVSKVWLRAWKRYKNWEKGKKL
jgi:hypothetical protein